MTWTGTVKTESEQTLSFVQMTNGTLAITIKGESQTIHLTMMEAMEVGNQINNFLIKNIKRLKHEKNI